MTALEIPDYLIAFRSVALVIVVVAISLIVFFGILRANLTGAEKWRFAITIAVVGLSWMLLATGLAVNGIFMAGAFGSVPAIGPAFLLPILVFSVVLTRSKTAGAVLDAIPLDWLIRIQFVRVLGGIFVVLYIDGLIPGEFALPAGLGDMATGLLALLVAYLVAHGSVWARSSAYAWNIFGMLDLVIAGALGFLTTPGRFQQLAFEDPNRLITQYPLVMIPVFAVPLMFTLHILCLRKLARTSSRDARSQSSSELGAT